MKSRMGHPPSSYSPRNGSLGQHSPVPFFNNSTPVRGPLRSPTLYPYVSIKDDMNGQLKTKTNDDVMHRNKFRFLKCAKPRYTSRGIQQRDPLSRLPTTNLLHLHLHHHRPPPPQSITSYPTPQILQRNLTIPPGSCLQQSLTRTSMFPRAPSFPSL